MKCLYMWGECESDPGIHPCSVPPACASPGACPVAVPQTLSAGRGPSGFTVVHMGNNKTKDSTVTNK